MSKLKSNMILAKKLLQARLGKQLESSQVKLSQEKLSFVCKQLSLFTALHSAHELEFSN